ncbi:MAG: NADH-ubiquinone oxidoreductase subunit NDUFA12 family protein, partial [Caulobacter sp.]
VPAEWHGWLHYTLDEVPTAQPLPRKEWEKDHLPNLTGTVHAWRPKGSIARGGERQAATGDYQAWSPE